MKKRTSSALALLAACSAPGPLSTTTTGITSVSDGTISGSSSSSGDSSSTGTSETGEPPADATSSSSESTPILDVGSHDDLGPVGPAGCKGKIDFLFVIDRYANMQYRQAQLVAAFPQFIATIQAKFADFDYHIMVVDGDGPEPGGGWGSTYCNETCAYPGCKKGEPCCPYDKEDPEDTPCCTDPNYPCEHLDLMTPCDEAWGAGTVFPAGHLSSDRPCPIDDSRRYLVTGQTNLEETFACIATIGVSGSGAVGQALDAAMQKPMNQGGCNDGFLRDDALLMITLIMANPDAPGPASSDGYAYKWAQSIRDAKHGDDEAVVILHIGSTHVPCESYDRTCVMTAMFPYYHREAGSAPDYGPAFDEATNLVETACAGYEPPG